MRCICNCWSLSVDIAITLPPPFFILAPANTSEVNASAVYNGSHYTIVVSWTVSTHIQHNSIHENIIQITYTDIVHASIDTHIHVYNYLL